MRLSGAMILLCLALAACTRTGKLEQEGKKIDSAAAEHVQVQVSMDDGELEIKSHYGEPLLDGQFGYNIAAWRPDISYSILDKSGKLTVQQPTERGWIVGRIHNWWSLSLMQGPSMDLKVTHETGSTRLDLGDLHLNSVNALFGTGDWHFNLHGSQPDLAITKVISERGNGHFSISGSLSELRRIEINQGQGALTADLSGDYRVLSEAHFTVDEGALDVNLTGDYGGAPHVRANLGRGNVIVDLRGTWAHGGDINLSLKSGHLRVWLPSNVVIAGQASVKDGFVNAVGVEFQHNQLSYKPVRAAPTLQLNIAVGTGTVSLERTD